MISFQRATADGWRYALGYRTRQSEDEYGRKRYWELQRWVGTGWEGVGARRTYAGIRELATRDRGGRQ